VVERTLREPPGAVTHWTGRAMAKAMGLSLRTIQRIWAAHKLQSHRIRLNAVEGFFSKLTRQSLKRGVFRSVDDLESAITRHIAATNRHPKPFVWTATTKAIQAELRLNHPSESVHQ
jgi:hypothetical protein